MNGAAALLASPSTACCAATAMDLPVSNQIARNFTAPPVRKRNFAFDFNANEMAQTQPFFDDLARKWYFRHVDDATIGTTGY